MLGCTINIFYAALLTTTFYLIYDSKREHLKSQIELIESGLNDKVHHVAVFYLVRQTGGALGIPEQFVGQDSLGARWVKADEVSIDNASPLVLEAFRWIKEQQLALEARRFTDWHVLK